MAFEFLVLFLLILLSSINLKSILNQIQYSKDARIVISNALMRVANLGDVIYETRNLMMYCR